MFFFSNFTDFLLFLVRSVFALIFLFNPWQEIILFIFSPRENNESAFSVSLIKCNINESKNSSKHVHNEVKFQRKKMLIVFLDNKNIILHYLLVCVCVFVCAD